MVRVKFTCRWCGKVMMVFPSQKERQYCSRSCGNRGRSLPREDDFDPALKWELVEDNRWQCPYEENVSCKLRKCTTCGWNPKVAEMRLKQFLRMTEGGNGNGS